jgi:cobalt-zinc-cadmium efflux system protein
MARAHKHKHDHNHEHTDCGRDHGHAEESHNHAHGGHGHSHAPASFGKAFAIGISLNMLFVGVEAAYGVWGNSMALLADAGHNLSDVLGLVVAWLATVLVKRLPTPRLTYGLRGSSILAALFNAVFLLVAVGALSWEAVQRLSNPQPIEGGVVMVVAAIGILINGITAWLFASGSKSDINLRGAFMHMLADALVSAGVVIAGLVIIYTNWLWLDPVVSIVINAIIVWGTWSLLRDSLGMSMAAVPAHIDPAKVKAFLASQKGVTAVHDVHIWPMSTTETALTCHLLMPKGHPGDKFLHKLTHDLAEKFGINHPTVQIEVEADASCALAPENVV